MVLFIVHFFSGLDICKSYTVVPSALLPASQDKRVANGTVLYLMIKIYSDGEITPTIAKLNKGKVNLCVFHQYFENSKVIYLNSTIINFNSLHG